MQPNMNPYNKLNSESSIEDILNNNKEWLEKYPEGKEIFSQYNGQEHKPHTLLICCSDSRYNENIFNTVPGEIFTYKIIANMCNEDNIQFRSTLEFAINCLGIRRVILCGHTDCGGINTCLLDKRDELIDSNNHNLYHYLQEINDLIHDETRNIQLLKSLADKNKYVSIKNIESQYNKLLQNTVIQAHRQNLSIYKMIYNVDSGIVEVV